MTVVRIRDYVAQGPGRFMIEMLNSCFAHRFENAGTSAGVVLLPVRPKSDFWRPNRTPAVCVDEFAREDLARTPLVPVAALYQRAIITGLFCSGIDTRSRVNRTRIVCVLHGRCHWVVFCQMRQILGIRSASRACQGTSDCNSGQLNELAAGDLAQGNLLMFSSLPGPCPGRIILKRYGPNCDAL